MTRRVVSGQGVNREHREGCVHGRGFFCTMNLSAALSEGLSMRVMKSDGNRANVQGEGIASMEMDDFKARPSGSQPVLTQTSLLGELPAPIQKFVYHVFSQALDVLCNVLVGGSSLHD